MAWGTYAQADLIHIYARKRFGLKPSAGHTAHWTGHTLLWTLAIRESTVECPVPCLCRQKFASDRAAHAICAELFGHSMRTTEHQRRAKITHTLAGERTRVEIRRACKAQEDVPRVRSMREHARHSELPFGAHTSEIDARISL